jgi:hypothetical protein
MNLPASPLPSTIPIAVIAGIVIIVIVVIAFLALVLSVPSGPPSLPGVGGDTVHVSEVAASSPDNACGLNGIVTGGFDSGPFEYEPITWVLPASGSVAPPCTVTNATTNTSGFEIVASLPFTANSTMTFFTLSVLTPASFDGVLNITFM